MIKGAHFATLLLAVVSMPCLAEDGYDLWLRYTQVQNADRLQEYRQLVHTCAVLGASPDTREVIESELATGTAGMLGEVIGRTDDPRAASLVVFTSDDTPAMYADAGKSLVDLAPGSYSIAYRAKADTKQIVIVGKDDAGALYGMFHLLRLMQMQEPLEGIAISESPAHDIRLLNHWDNLDRTVERGYAGFSIWDWHRLPEYIDPRYRDYARANASIGINGTVLTNVNANALVLRADYLDKVKALAGVLRPYGMRVYLTARFSAPVELGGLETADPLDPSVRDWWEAKIAEIYTIIPDFGGFLVKANSEGQPGPQNYGRTHADGANMLAEAVGSYGGVVMWRAFVYDDGVPEDRAKQAYNEFVPLDGNFRENVLIQVKNGPIDFQPREPPHPMFGAMPQTPLMMEFQITQEYLGQGTHLVYLGPMYEEVLDFDTYAQGEGSTVASVVNGNLHGYPITGMAGVSNIGNDRNWTGHLFGQANWYAFGRLAWDPGLTSEAIAGEWIRQTLSNDLSVISPVQEMMAMSHEACVRYMTPLGLHHIMGAGHHYGPGPWVSEMPRADWTSVYYHKADTAGVGFDRTASGSNAVSQYFTPVQEMFRSPETCPDKYLLWFHHLPWDEPMGGGETLWEAICRTYHQGVDQVREMAATWESLSGRIDRERHRHVSMLLDRQVNEAIWWRDACLSYFQSFSRMPIPEDVPPPEESLEFYRHISHPYAPGIRPRW